MQYVTDLCLNELEDREALDVMENGTPVAPYVADHMVKTILTRSE